MEPMRTKYQVTFEFEAEKELCIGCAANDDGDCIIFDVMLSCRCNNIRCTHYLRCPQCLEQAKEVKE